MVRNMIQMLAVAAFLSGASCADGAPPKEGASDSKAIEGLWSGAWGGGARDGVVFQPVIAELFIQGDHVELEGFRNVGSFSGTVRLDSSAKRLHITPKAETSGPPAPKTIDYAYEIKADTITLTDGDKVSISLRRRGVVKNPLANVTVELVEATGISAAGDLLVTEFTVLRAGRIGAPYFQPENRSLKTKKAIVLMMQEAGWKRMTVDEARGLVRKSTPVVVTYSHDDRPSPNQFHQLWKDMGAPRPDSDAVWQTLLRILRPGSLVFILSASENVVVP
jgi:hypothetical protein